jgi:formate dehydrogenase subunit delta
MLLDRLIYMANQIGRVFLTQGAGKAAARTADHLIRFWDPRMRGEIVTHLDAGGEGLDPIVREALAIVRAQGKAGTPAASVGTSTEAAD